MMFVETIPGNNTHYLLFDLENQTIEKKPKEESLPDEVIYCFDLYKLSNLFNDIPFMYDIQSLLGIKLQKFDLLEEIFDDGYATGFKSSKETLNAHIKSYLTCKIPVSKFNLQQLIPEDVLDTFYKEKLNCIKSFLKENFFEQDVLNFYEQVFDAIKSVIGLKKNYVLIDSEKKNFLYNVFGSKNSRLSIRKNSFNIFNLPKEKRDCIKSLPGYTLCQIDFKSFQPRLALATFGSGEIKYELSQNEDIYRLFEGDREENKIQLISWMFSNRRNEKFDKKLEIIKQARKHLHHDSKSGMVYNLFFRPLFFDGEEENVVFQNYICSLEADCILSLVEDVQEKLKGSKSYLAFPFHDCLVFSIYEDEIDKINELKTFIETYLYKRFNVNFPVSIKVGSSFGSLVDFT